MRANRLRNLIIDLPGQTSHPKVKEAELRTIKTALKFGVRPRIELNKSVQDYKEEIKKYIDLGVRDFNLPSDLSILFKWFKRDGEELKKELS